MVIYLALRLEQQKLNYNVIFGRALYRQFQDDVDTILATDGYYVNDEGWCIKGLTGDAV